MGETVESLFGLPLIDLTPVALPDALLGQRLAGATSDRAATAAQLHANGANALITGAFRERIAA